MCGMLADRAHVPVFSVSIFFFANAKHKMNTIPNNTSVTKPKIVRVILYRHTLCDWNMESVKTVHMFRK
jgi:hypothetical protein